VATARNYPYHDYVMKFGQIVGRLTAWAHLRGLRKLPHVVACSATFAGLLRRHGVACTVIRDGVDTAVFSPAPPAEAAALRARLNLPAEARVGVSGGSLSARKDPLTVVRAMRGKLSAANVVMVFAGGGDLESECRRE